MKKFFADFKAFIARGNVMDMAIGVIVGGAFGKIVTSLVNDIIMPLLAWAMGGNTVASLCVVLNGVPQYLEDGALNPDAICWNYGNFIQTILDFLIIAFCVFLMLKLVMKAKSAVAEGVDDLKDKIKGKREDEIAQEEQGKEETPVAETAPVAEPVPAPVASDETALLTEIRDLLKGMQPTAAED